MRLVLPNIVKPVRVRLDRYGITTALGPDTHFGSTGQALDAFGRSRHRGWSTICSQFDGGAPWWALPCAHIRKQGAHRDYRDLEN